MNSTTTQLPSGTYHIVVFGGGKELKRLTRGNLSQGNPVTISPPSDGVRQEWDISHDKDGTTIILPVTPNTKPVLQVQVPYLTYKGAPEKPEAGDQIVLLGTIKSPNKWRLKHTSTSTAFIQVDGSDFGIAVARPDIIPPILDLKDKNQLEWMFEFVRPRSEK